MEPHVVVRRSARRQKTLSARREGDTIVVTVPAWLPHARESAEVSRLVEKFLAREAKRAAPRTDAELLHRAQRLAREVLTAWPEATTRVRSVSWSARQWQRWGSCTTATGEIRLSERMRTMPDWVVDYVIVHELTHLIEVNHTPRFHAIVASYPRTLEARAFLQGVAFARHEPDELD